MILEFKNKGKTFRHIGNGRCAKEVDKRTRDGTSWRIFFGEVQPGALYPGYMTAYCDKSGDFIDFENFDECVEWVEKRRRL